MSNYNNLSNYTRESYETRTFNLVARWRRENGPFFDHEMGGPRLFVEWLIKLRSSLVANSWRQYKAASVFILYEQHDWLWPLSSDYDVRYAVNTLAQEGQQFCLKQSDKTSSTKSKKVSLSDIKKLANYFREHPSKMAGPIISFLSFNRFVGLRPCECESCHIVWDPKDQTLKLTAKNAKHNAARANGLTRTMTFYAPTPSLVNSALYFFHFVENSLKLSPLKTQQEQWDATIGLMGDALAYANRRIWPRRQSHFTLYCARHDASAFFKTYLLPEETAALLGHSTDETAYRHYARANPKSGALGVARIENLPSPDPTEVARVRLKLDRRNLKYEASQSNLEL